MHNTEEKNRIERELHDSRVEWEALMQGVDEGIVAREPSGRVVYANEVGARLLGFSSVDDLLATFPDDLSSRYEFYDESGRLIPYDRLPSRMAFEGRPTPPTTVRFRMLPDGEERWAILKTIPIRDKSKKIQFVVSVFSDITERRQAEEALRASEARFHAFMDNSPIVAFMKDENGRFVYASHPFARLFETTVEALVGSPDSELVPPEVLEHIRRDDKEVLETGRLKEIVELIPTPGHLERYFLTFKFPVTDQGGRRLLGGASIEITERVKSEEALHQYAERLEAMSRQMIDAQENERRRIARDLHDQIGQSLTAIKIDLQIAQRQASAASLLEPLIPRSEPVESPHSLYVERLQRSIEMVEKTIQQVREFSLDLRPSILDDLGLPSALLWYVEEQCERAGLESEIAIEQVDTRLSPALEITCFRIAQEAITNIVRHARAGRVSVELRGRHGKRDEIVLLVTDDGVGFDPQALASGQDSGAEGRGNGKVLKGTSRIKGLGLTGMHERMMLVGGSMSIESVPGHGTTVRAVFPLPASPSPPADTGEGTQ